jgi:hypothetical protein
MQKNWATGANKRRVAECNHTPLTTIRMHRSLRFSTPAALRGW